MIKKFIQKFKRFIGSALREHNTQIAQIQLYNQYLLMKKILSPAEMPRFSEVGFSVHSQFEEDGILLYIFSIIGTTNKQVLEICAGDGTECMASNLIINHGWNGLLFDGNVKLVEKGIKYFAKHNATWLYPPTFVQAWLTIENINQLIKDNNFNGEIDLLSLDIDGNDYYIMEAINVVTPRVIICETNNVIPDNLSLTIPYKSDFDRMDDLHPDFMSVSLLAMKKLLNKKGYRLVGAHRHGFNAIFIMNGIAEDYFPEVSVESVHKNSAYTKFRNTNDWEKIKNFPWVSV